MYVKECQFFFKYLMFLSCFFIQLGEFKILIEMKVFIFFVFMVLVLSSCIICMEVNENCIEDIDFDCVCYLVYDLVCGCNDVIYGNFCEVECVNIIDYILGFCLE